MNNQREFTAVELIGRYKMKSIKTKEDNKNFNSGEFPILNVKNAEGNPDTVARVIVENKIDYTPKVSVIIPVYNVAEYLRECLDSVINQTLKEIEIICVDDGSTDNSLEILKEYAAKDKRITLFSYNHNGTGFCRNIGLSRVKGEYVGFMDPDDFIEAEYFEKLYNASIKDTPDIVFQTSRIEFYPDGKEKVIDTPSSENDMVFRLNIIDKSAHIWSKIFNRNFILEYNLKNAYVRRSQDLMFTLPAILIAKEIKCIANAKYYYRKGHESVTSKSYYTEKDIEEQISLYDEIDNKINTYCPQYSFFIKYKKNNILRKIFKESSYDLQSLINESVKSDYFTDFGILDANKSISIKNPSPDKFNKLWWGDYWLGLDLASSLKSEGFKVQSDYFERWNDKNQANINIVIRGPKQFNCFDYNKLNLLYLMSCPEDVSAKELNNYDIVVVASQKLKKIVEKYHKKVFLLHQFTNPLRFYPCYDSAFKNEILFIGNAYNNKIRKSVKYCIENNLPLSVYGNFWKNKIDEKYNKGVFVDNNLLYKYYSNAAIVLNDTTDGMRQNGIISNRIFDVTACKGFIISDYVPEIAEIYGDAIPMYKNKAEFNKIVRYYLEHPEERRKKAEKAYNITLNNYTNAVFAKKISEIINDCQSSNDKIYCKKFDVNFYKNLLEGWYNTTTKQDLDLDDPKTFNEKIQWMKLYDSTPIKTRLADKYLVRDWVKEKIGEEYLIPLLGVYDSFEEIDFDSLPNQFVIKCNHGSAMNIIVKDKSQLDLSEVKEKLDRWMNENFAYHSFELHYRDIKPKIIIEKFITNDGVVLYDYKFWCFNGKVKYMQFRDDFSSNLKMVFYNLDWKKQPFFYDHSLYENELEKPYNFDEMVEIAKKLCQDFAFVCVDLYRLNDGSIKFGEMTFTRSSGCGKWNEEKYNRYMGDLISLPKLAYNIDTGKYYKLPKYNLFKSFMRTFLKGKKMAKKTKKSKIFSITKTPYSKTYCILGIKFTFKDKIKKVLYELQKNQTLLLKILSAYKSDNDKLYKDINKKIKNLSDDIAQLK